MLFQHVYTHTAVLSLLGRMGSAIPGFRVHLGVGMLAGAWWGWMAGRPTAAPAPPRPRGAGSKSGRNGPRSLAALWRPSERQGRQGPCAVPSAALGPGWPTPPTPPTPHVGLTSPLHRHRATSASLGLACRSSRLAGLARAGPEQGGIFVTSMARALIKRLETVYIRKSFLLRCAHRQV